MGTANKMFNLCRSFSQLSFLRNLNSKHIDLAAGITRTISTTGPRRDLMEFFDDKKNWGAIEVKSGRSWNKEEMRLKSNTDLHKLWYVLLKERNMLLTMEQEANDKCELFPSPERLDKVEESMENLEAVVRERNVAYHQLETGETGERPVKDVIDAVGLRRKYKLCEHSIPRYMNKSFKKKYPSYQYNKDSEDFLVKFREKKYLEKRRERNRNFNHVIKLLNRFPNLDMDALKAQYPDVDIDKAKASRKYGGHFEPK